MATLDDRLNALEMEVAILRGQIVDRNDKNWIETVAGSLRDEPEFDEVLRLGREARRGELFDHPNGGPEG
jgi:hypothetical protein